MPRKSTKSEKTQTTKKRTQTKKNIKKITIESKQTPEIQIEEKENEPSIKESHDSEKQTTENETINSTQKEQDLTQKQEEIKQSIISENEGPKETKKTKIEEKWHFDVDTKAPYDPLLGCLLTIAKLKKKPSSEQSLTAGLPLINNKLIPELFKRAASRIGLSSKIVRQKLKYISRQSLPAVLFLDQKQACVLIDIREDGNAVIIKPESGDGFIEMPFDILAKNYTGYAIFVEQKYSFNQKKIEEKKDKTKNWFWSVLTKAWPLYGEVLIASLLINIFTIASPLFIMNVYDRVVPNHAMETLWVLSIGIIIVFSFDFLLRTLRASFIDSTGKKVDVELSKNIFEQIMDLEMSERPKSVGSLANTVYAFESFRDLITSATLSILVDIPFIILFIALTAVLGGTVAIVPLIVVPLVLLVSFFIQVPLNHLVQQTYESASEKQSILIESLAGVETIKSMRAEGLMQSRWEQITKALSKLGVKLRTLANIGLNFSIYAQHLAIVSIVIIGVHRISSGKMTIGALIACTILAGRALAPISQIAMLVTRYKQSKRSLESINNIMALPTERPHNKTFLHRPTLHGKIEFKTVSFNYPEQLLPALTNVSFKITPGEKIGIIGRTGSGKTTIEKLLMKFYPTTSGRILVDNIEIHQLDPAELRYYIGYIPQDVVLFNGTIRDNIIIGAPYVDDTAVLRASQLSGVDSFVNQHPLGFDREVQERGQNLSGGQRQAIAIARAMLLNPPVLVFDEPCNSMDDTTIAHFFARLKQQMSNKTLILVTHRSSLLQLVDRLIVLDRGHVILDGPKNDVIQQLKNRQK